MEFTASTLLLSALIQAVDRTVDISPYAKLVAANLHKLNFIKQTNEVRQSTQIKMQILFSDNCQNYVPSCICLAYVLIILIGLLNLRHFFMQLLLQQQNCRTNCCLHWYTLDNFFVLLNYIIKYVHTIKSILATSVGLQG